MLSTVEHEKRFKLVARLFIEPMQDTIIKIDHALCEQLDMPGHTL